MRVTAAEVTVSNAVVFDNARTGSAVVVPEAGTVALLLPALGVLGAVVAARKRK
ncbi:MAG: PEP-CTERM sorting domain-containing protein [Armatimonadetes bacterium]|nr:PEP-CTERM sorting domain-containing protein [Armatimonadota bacterium]